MIKKVKSFTIVEIMVAMTIFGLIMGGSIVLIQQTVRMTTYAKNKLIAYYLGQEGIELIRSMRDDNWLKQRADGTTAWDAVRIGALETVFPRHTFCYFGISAYCQTMNDSSAQCFARDYDDSSLKSYWPVQKFNVSPGTGIYSYNTACSGSPLPAGCTTFDRRIQIARHICNPDVEICQINDPIRVESYVFWTERNKTYHIVVKDQLWNWYGIDTP